MTSYKTKAIPSNSLISYITFSCWDNTAGPLTKLVWTQPPAGPDAATVKLLTRLVLKTEVTRCSSEADIDCNVYSLPDLPACAVSYLFSATCKSKIGKTIYCITFVYKLEQRTKYLLWCDILDGVIKQKITEYRVCLHKDFQQLHDRSKLGVKDKFEMSNIYLYEIIGEVIDLVNRLESTRMDYMAIRVEETCFCDRKTREREFLQKVVTSMVLSFNRVVVVGSERDRSRVNKWVRTLSMLLTSKDRERCFLSGSLNQVFIPNAFIQGQLLNEEFMANRSRLLRLYTMCDYPLTIVELAKPRVYRTANYLPHKMNQDKIRRAQLLEIYSPNTPSFWKLLEQTKSDHFTDSETSTLIHDMLKQLYEVDLPGRLAFLDHYMSFLRSKCPALIEYLQHKVKDPTSEQLPRDTLKKYIFMTKCEVDVEITLCLSEVVQPGIYNFVTDGWVDNKPNKVNDAL